MSGGEWAAVAVVLFLIVVFVIEGVTKKGDDGTL